MPRKRVTPAMSPPLLARLCLVTICVRVPRGRISLLLIRVPLRALWDFPVRRERAVLVAARLRSLAFGLELLDTSL